MLLLTLRHAGELIRCSTHSAPLEHQWHGYVSKIDPVQVRSSRTYGGWIRVSLPTVTFSPELFDADAGKLGTYPPPRQLYCTVQGTGSTEAAAVDLCSGVLALKTIAEKEIEYDLYSSPYFPIPGEGETLAIQYSADASSWHNSYADGDRYLRYSLNGGGSYGAAVQFLIPAGTDLATWAPSPNLVSGFFTQLCSRLGLTLDSTLAGASDPAITATISSATLMLDVADSVAAYFGYWFWIDGTTLHLINGAVENGTGYNFGLWDYVRGPKYSWQAPVNAVYDDAGKVSIFGNTLFGQQIGVGQSFYGADNSFLKIISATMELPQCEVSAMDFYGQFRPGRKLMWLDDRHARTVVGDMAMRSVQYDFGASGDRITIVGETILESGL